MPLLTRINKRAKKSLSWLRGWFHAHVTLPWICLTRRPIRDLSLFQRRIPVIERREFSQNGEDGMIAAIFAKIGTTNRYCVEFGVEDGLQCNCRYLLKHRGWKGLLMDGGDWTGDKQTKQKQQTGGRRTTSGTTSISQPLARNLYPPPPFSTLLRRGFGGQARERGVPIGQSNDDKQQTSPLSRGEGARGRGWYTDNNEKKSGSMDTFMLVHQEFVTAENIEDLFEKYGVPQEFDLLSIDIDGNDYWVWRAIMRYRPRVVIVEYNANKGPEASVTVPYDPAFLWDKTDYQGASLRALEKLGREKGYVLVGTDRCGVNAFFVLQGLIAGNFDPPPFAQIFHPPAYKGIPGKGHPQDSSSRPWVTI